MKAIVMSGEPGKASLVTDRPYPQHRPGYVLVDTKAVALNPTDWKHIEWMNHKGLLVGCDYSGVVAETGTGYSKPWKVGDRICGFAHGSNELQPEDGAFAERIAVKADVQMRIPDHMSFEDAATIGVAVVTSFYERRICIHLRSSSATGTVGIQFAKLAGYTPITTCSPRNFDLVKSLGAVAAFDYNDPECATKIKEYTKNDLKYVWDTISLPKTAQLCSEVISPGGTYGSILNVEFPRTDVRTTYNLGYTAVGDPVKKRFFESRDNTKDFEFMKKWIQEVEPILEHGRLKAHPPKVGKGLENVLEGCDLMKHDKVSGQKLVYVL
ncbi:hypothetical protein CLAIMM_13088 [Cladophialophora immunda]|nr:hypothetical protein CLAIMM_13088 [Cladophialophora immunda]